MPARYDSAPVRPFGSYGYQPVIGFVKPDPQLCFGGRRIMGTTLASHWIYGAFRSLDGEKLFTWMKHYTNQGALSLMIYEADVDPLGGDADLRYLKESKGAYRGGCYAGERDGWWGVWDCLDDETPRFSAFATPTQGHWVEKGLIDVTGDVRLDSVQLAVPDATSPLVYTSRCMWGGGTFLGREVEGFWDMDTVHLADGQDWLITPYYRDLQGAWVFFHTEFEDGTIQIGTMFCGREGFQGFAVQRTDGPNVVAVQPSFEVDLDENEYPIRVTAIVDDDEAWEWTRFPSGSARMPTMNVVGGPRWIQGMVRRRGDDRPVRHAEAFMETYADRLQHLLAPGALRLAEPSLSG